MKIIKEDKTWPLFLLIIPAFPADNIFTRFAKSMTALGPIMVATSANKLWGWRVAVIDENNYEGPRDDQGLPDHQALQRENPAFVVGFYCGLTSTIERVWRLAEFYRKQGVITIAGGWHAHYCPEETLKKNMDIVVHGDGEIVIQQILRAIAEEKSFTDIPGISFWESGEKRTNPPAMLEIPDLNDLPHPDFGLLRFARKIKYYSIGRIRGCKMNCEFCSVKGEPRWACAKHLFDTVTWLVETKRSRHFFIVDDRLEGDIQGTIKFFRMIAEKYGNRLIFTVQIRLEAAKNIEFLEVMKAAGVTTVCVGYESPIDEDLRTMRKGYLSSHMIEWTRILLHYFRVHGMFIFGYPAKEISERPDVRKIVQRFKVFIRQAGIDSIQVMHAVPLVGTDLRARLEKKGMIFPLELVPWSRYDGNYACFMPENMSLAEFQETPIMIMKWFYNPFSFFRIPLRTIIFPLDILFRGWHRWHRGWMRDIINYGGHLLIRRWQKRQESNAFLKRLEKRQLG